MTLHRGLKIKKFCILEEKLYCLLNSIGQFESSTKKFVSFSHRIYSNFHCPYLITILPTGFFFIIFNKQFSDGLPVFHCPFIKWQIDCKLHLVPPHGYLIY